MGLLALRVAFDGRAFAGSQRQPDVRTVDGDLLRALDAIGAGTKGFRASSRTDAGVSAAGYVVAVETDFRAEDLCPALTAQLRDAWVWAWAEAPAGFDPRRAARSRTYRYFLAQEVEATRLRAALACFVGEHDFSAFARVEDHRSPRRTVDRIDVTEAAGLLALDVVGPSFLWNQVRRMVAAAVAHARGEVDLAEIRAALAEGRGRDLGVAPAEGLVLLDVDVPVAWRRDDRALRRAQDALGERARAWRRDAATADALLAALSPQQAP